MHYKSFESRTPDFQYSELLKRIVQVGETVDTQQDEPAKMIFGAQMRFELSNGFPIVTVRDLSPYIYKGFGEILAFINGARTTSELESFGCNWWSRWATSDKCTKRGLATGDLGPGSYGPAFTAFPSILDTDDGTIGFYGFNQWQNLIEQIKELPHLRTHFISPWIPQYIARGEGKKQQVVVAPCHGWVHVRIVDNRLNLHHFQRSADLPVGVAFNLAQYALIQLMLSQVLGYEPGEYVYSMSDVHIYQSQFEAVKILLEREPTAFPTVTLDSTVKDFFEFRPNHIKIGDYNPHPKMTIPTPV